MRPELDGGFKASDLALEVRPELIRNAFQIRGHMVKRSIHVSWGSSPGRLLIRSGEKSISPSDF